MIWNYALLVSGPLCFLLGVISERHYTFWRIRHRHHLGRYKAARRRGFTHEEAVARMRHERGRKKEVATYSPLP
jgi:hypothetical protein